MPLASKAQARWAFANQGKQDSTGAAAREFVNATPAGGIKRLPERVGKQRSAKPQNKPRKPFGSFAP